MTNIVKNDSKGYGYNYASLADISRQGYTIPKMKTGTEGNKEYVFYFDTELNEWVRGAEIVIPENIITKEGKKKMNEAQLYGSALSYARRYTVLMANCLATDDDKGIENFTSSDIFDIPTPQELVFLFKRLYTNEEQIQILNHYGISRVEDIKLDALEKYVKDRNG